MAAEIIPFKGAVARREVRRLKLAAAMELDNYRATKNPRRLDRAIQHTQRALEWYRATA